MFNKKVRAWHKLKKQMFKVTAMDFEYNTANICPLLFNKTPSNLRLRGIDMDVLIIMQESDVTDAKGICVFEGDLIKWEDNVYAVSYGWYGDGATKITEYGWHIVNALFSFKYVGGGELVGNIYENPKGGIL